MRWPGRTLTALAVSLPAILPALAETPSLTEEKVKAALPAFRALVEDTVAKDQVPGISVAIVYKDQIVYLEGYGLRETGKTGAIGPDTVFQIASFSKPISATVVAAAITESKGEVSWDSKISDLDPAFRLSEAWPTGDLTVTDLFSHRSGLPGAAGNELEEIGYDQADILGKLRQVPLDGFRSHYSYSNFGLTEGGVAVARAMGVEWPDLAEQLLYKPLHMTSTSSRYADFLKHDDRAELHVPLGGHWVAAVKRQPDAQAPAGGVSSTARDLAEWLRVELANGDYDGKPFIDKAAIAATHQPLIDRGLNPVNGAHSFYGRGWNVEFGRYGLSWGHAGAFSTGSRTLVTILPDAELGIVVLTNCFPSGVPEGLADSFLDLAFTGKVQSDWISSWNAAYAGLFGPAIEAAKARFAKAPDPATSALADSAYVGRYGNDYIGEATVTAGNGGLELAVGPGGKTVYPLQPFDRDIFITHPSPEMPEMPAGVSFTIGPDGKAATVTIESLDDVGLGTLKRIGG